MSLTTNELVEKMHDALKREYRKRKGKNLPLEFEEDQKLLFAAIARGLLEYLETKQFILTITFTDGGIKEQRNVAHLKLNITPQK